MPVDKIYYMLDSVVIICKPFNPSPIIIAIRTISCFSDEVTRLYVVSSLIKWFLSSCFTGIESDLVTALEAFNPKADESGVTVLKKRAITRVPAGTS